MGCRWFNHWIFFCMEKKPDIFLCKTFFLLFCFKSRSIAQLSESSVSSLKRRPAVTPRACLLSKRPRESIQKGKGCCHPSAWDQVNPCSGLTREGQEWYHQAKGKKSYFFPQAFTNSSGTKKYTHFTNRNSTLNRSTGQTQKICSLHLTLQCVAVRFPGNKP